MLSTTNQKPREKRSRSSDTMSDLEKMDVMLGSYSRNVEESNQDVGEMYINFESGGPQN